MKLDQLILSVEIQGNHELLIFDQEKDEYTEHLIFDDANKIDIPFLEEYGGYDITFIYPKRNAIVIEITREAP